MKHHQKGEHDEGGKVIHATPRHKRVEYNQRIWDDGLRQARGRDEVPFRAFDLSSTTNRPLQAGRMKITSTSSMRTMLRPWLARSYQETPLSEFPWCWTRERSSVYGKLRL